MIKITAGWPFSPECTIISTSPFPGDWYASQVTRFDGSFSMPETIEEIHLDQIEGILLRYLFTTGKKAID